MGCKRKHQHMVSSDVYRTCNLLRWQHRAGTAAMPKEQAPCTPALLGTACASDTGIRNTIQTPQVTLLDL